MIFLMEINCKIWLGKRGSPEKVDTLDPERGRIRKEIIDEDLRMVG
jgi:hypothetical protein